MTMAEQINTKYQTAVMMAEAISMKKVGSVESIRTSGTARE